MTFGLNIPLEREVEVDTGIITTRNPSFIGRPSDLPTENELQELHELHLYELSLKQKEEETMNATNNSITNGTADSITNGSKNASINALLEEYDNNNNNETPIYQEKNELNGQTHVHVGDLDFNIKSDVLERFNRNTRGGGNSPMRR